MKHVFSSVVLLLPLILLAATAYSDDPLIPLEPGITAPANMQEYLESSEVMRYRYVTADIDYLWKLFESSQDLDDINDADLIQLKLFDDFSVELKLVTVYHRYWWSYANLVTTLPGFGTDPESNIRAEITLRRDEGVSAEIRAAGDFYYILPVDEGPIHVIWQADPAKMPNMDSH